MSESMLIEILTGPFSALVLAVILLYGLFKLAAKYIPKVVERHLKQIDEQMDSQRAITQRLESMESTFRDLREDDRELMRGLASNLHKRLTPIETDIKAIKAYTDFKQGVKPIQNTEGLNNGT